MTYISVYGPLVAPWDVEQATIATLKAWLPALLADCERQHPGLTLPRSPSLDASVYGGEDFDSWKEDDLPVVIASVKPAGSPERAGAGDYGQMFELQVAAVTIEQDEDAARMVAGYYGTVIAAIVAQQGGLGGVVGSTRITDYVDLQWPDPDQRRLARSVCTFHSWVDIVVTEQAGLATPPPDPSMIPPPSPPVTTVSGTVIAVPIGQPV